jgi:DNA-binding NarL/FixJ family response regulator
MDPLTYRERQIADLVAQGLTARVIAHRLGLAPQTVKNTKSVIYQKLGVRNAPEMVRVLVQIA